MPFWWPFGRRKRKNKRKSKVIGKASPVEEKRSTEKSDYGTSKHTPRIGTPPAAEDPFSDTWQTSRATSRQETQEKTPVTPQRTRSPIGDLGGVRESAEDITALPNSPPGARSPHLQRTVSPTSPIAITRSSSKKRRSQLREEEIRSMSSPIPIPRPPRDETTELLRKHSKRLRETLGQDSMVSLPNAASIRSSVTGFSDNQFEVGSMSVFNPRPAIRYSIQSPYLPSLKDASGPSRSNSKKEKHTSSKRVLNQRSTIDDLADGYDAGELREIMERDARRRNRKRQAEEDRARRRLERHAARAEGRSPTREETDRPRSKRIAPEGAETDQAGLGLTEAGMESSVQRRRELQQSQSGRESPIKTTEHLTRNPFTDELVETEKTEDESTLPTPASVIKEKQRRSVASTSPPASPIRHGRKDSNLSQTTDPARSLQNLTETTTNESQRKTMDSASPRKTGPLASLFRRSAAGKRVSEDQGQESGTSFSNTSRESMSRQPLPAHLRERPSVARQQAPTRTYSKFKEDLPEFTPPDSRMQSPETAEVPPIPAISARKREKMREGDTPEGSSPSQSEHRESMGDNLPSPAPVVSQSLGSVDSEAEWLSGRPPKRSSIQAPTTPGALEERPEQFKASYEDLGMPEEEYFRRLTVDPEAKSKASGLREALAASEDTQSAQAGEPEKGVEVKHGDVARKPTVVRQSRTKSNEGLLRQFRDDETEGEVSIAPSLAGDEASVEGSPVEAEATASPFKVHGSIIGHARQASVGSAKLLDIPSRRESVRSPSPVSSPTTAQAPESTEAKRDS